MMVIVVLIAACHSRTSTEAQPNATERPEPVVVYASYADESYLPDLFAGFTAKTGIPVAVRNGEPVQMVGDVIANQGSPAADVLLTDNAADIALAADEGALRPIAALNESNVAEFLRDPDDLWVATGLRVAVILRSQASTGGGPKTYADLADAEFRQRVCLASSTLSVNRSLIATLISELGVRPAEIMVRGWMRNLALPPFESEAALFDAVDKGSCDYGVVSSRTAIFSTSRHGDGTADFVIPQPAYFDIEGIGITRHAHHPEAAQLLVAWMLSADAQRKHTLGVHHYSARGDQLREDVSQRVSRQNIGRVGWHDGDAKLLAERAGYR